MWLMWIKRCICCLNHLIHLNIHCITCTFKHPVTLLESHVTLVGKRMKMRSRLEYLAFTSICVTCVIITIVAIVRFDVDTSSVFALIDGRRFHYGELRPYGEGNEAIDRQNKSGLHIHVFERDTTIGNRFNYGYKKTNSIVNDFKDRTGAQINNQSSTYRDNYRKTHIEANYNKVKQHFIVVTQPRCGSNLMDSYLNQHPLVTCYNELIMQPILSQFNLSNKSSRSQLLNYVGDIIGFASTTEPRTNSRTDFPGSTSATKTRFGTNAGLSSMISTGFKVHLSQMIKFNITMESFLRKLKRPKLILLYRKNLLEQYVSWQIAAETRLWWSTDIQNTISHKLRLNQFEHFILTERILWLKLMKLLRRNRYIRGNDYILVSYEDLVVDNSKTMNGVFKMLGYREERRHLFTWLLKQNPMSLSKKISNYVEIKPHLERLDYTLHVKTQLPSNFAVNVYSR
ncbi:unnamed protein product [Owenia fusiformis]|uniref:Sulfotransferase n=1 Tax=Owenia fusiformis TaxID=6347 RepID=A0A8S4NN61_OWEFU|nr:unnamed protein product [Owenia fusiformis]